MQIMENPWRGTGLSMPDVPLPSRDAAAPAALLARCPAHAVTVLHDRPDLAARIGVSTVHVKDERARMGLGSFKALGAAYVIAHEAEQAGGAHDTALAGRTYVTASAGNHGLSVAAGAQIFGARAVVYLSQTVPESFAARLRAKGAQVVREGAQYEASMQAAERAAQTHGWTLLSDSSWEGYHALPHRLMEGYLQLAAEVTDAMSAPTHVLLQAGVGGMAAAVATHLRAVWGDAVRIIVVEPTAAPALFAAIDAGALVDTEGPVSEMGRLDCKTASQIALAGLARDADAFALITEDEAAAALPVLAAAGLGSTPSGAAGFAAALYNPGALGLSEDARVLVILSEEAAS
ncbi:pyridoxal-phosphate dependent enzyme [Cognatishimia sp. F0-27]|uniref:pyridoxal-phosphate dependent enzyme n=1 Tax=Cognatishimia sp. F0-27 TaxID=2816855 RepID=UPI001D0C01E3|nr:pyridoxal-phosphate dependent enzyme [Cognatishimia sp. F0-27]MCC1493386.1 pyridoxal-phosphate dependent enzyme [Cognatishimia sp. F0-27]